MARLLFVSFLVVCLLCVIQAFPQSAAETAAEPTVSSKIETALNEAMESLQKSLKGIMEDPGLNKLVQDGQKFLENAATSIQNEAAKIVPKTE